MKRSGRPPYPTGTVLTALLDGAPLPGDGDAAAGRVIDGNFRRKDADPSALPVEGSGVAATPSPERAAPRSPASPFDPPAGAARADAPAAEPADVAASAQAPTASPSKLDVIGTVSAEVMLGQHRVPVVFGQDGKPWFVAAEVCAALGLRFRSDSRAARQIDGRNKGVGRVRTGLGGGRVQFVVNGCGLQQLIRNRRRPLTESLQRWVVEVLLTRSAAAGGAARCEPPGAACGPADDARISTAGTPRKADRRAESGGRTQAAAAQRATPERSMHKLMYGNHRLRIRLDGSGNAWFNANDVCAALEFANPHQALAAHVDREDVARLEIIDALGRRQRANHVSEVGLCALAFRSTKPVAWRFRRRVMAELRWMVRPGSTRGGEGVSIAHPVAPHRSMRDFLFGTQPVRVILGDDGVPWFVAAEVCAALQLPDTHKAVARLDSDDKGRNSIPTRGGHQDMTVINESGLYSLVLGSRKPVAQRFKRWVTGEVLPALCQTGCYEMAGFAAAAQAPHAAAEHPGASRGIGGALSPTPPAVPGPLARERLVGIEFEPGGCVRVAVHDPANGLGADRVWRADRGGRAPGRVVQYVLARLACRADDLLIVACDDLAARAPIVARETTAGLFPAKRWPSRIRLGRRAAAAAVAIATAHGRYEAWGEARHLVALADDRGVEWVGCRGFQSVPDTIGAVVGEPTGCARGLVEAATRLGIEQVLLAGAGAARVAAHLHELTPALTVTSVTKPEWAVARGLLLVGARPIAAD